MTVSQARTLTPADRELCVCGHERHLHGSDGGLCIRDEWCHCPGFQPMYCHHGVDGECEDCDEEARQRASDRHVGDVWATWANNIAPALGIEDEQEGWA